MKNIVTLGFITLFLFSCKNESIGYEKALESGDLNQLKEAKSTMQKEADELFAKIKKLDEKIAVLDTTHRIPVVSVEKIIPQAFRHYLDFQANIETDENVVVSPEFSGTLKLLVKEGQQVSRGQIIGKISDGGLSQQLKQAEVQVSSVKAQLQQAQAQVELAKLTYQKQQSLWNQKIGSEIQYLQSKTNYETAQKQVNALASQVSASQRGADAVRESLDKTNLRAPFSGIIDEVITQNGQAVSPGMQIVKLVNLSNMKAVVEVPETYLPVVGKGTQAEITIPALNNRELISRVSLLGNNINSANRTFKVEIPVQNADGLVKPNLIAKVKLIDYVNGNAIVVPKSILKIDASGNNFVFVLKGDKVEQRKITVGKQNNDGVEIVNGLSEGETVVVGGIQQLEDGNKVEVRN
ncbi:MAG: efflux RND transporter periplasmic adaptor subunit [Flavobacteriales bacterium]|nr:efflux RND transporter periplasmic adaptor subunit [Flavobacteriales bacterium]